MTIAIACDHVGYQLKMILKEQLESMGHTTIDFGCGNISSSDYPVYGEAAARAVSAGECDRGVLVCGTGFGISLAANRVPGIRCVNCSEPYTAKLSRMHNNANMLSLGARVVGPELAKMIVETFMTTDFEGGRHQRRLDMLDNIR